MLIDSRSPASGAITARVLASRWRANLKNLSSAFPARDLGPHPPRRGGGTGRVARQEGVCSSPAAPAFSANGCWPPWPTRTKSCARPRPDRAFPRSGGAFCENFPEAAAPLSVSRQGHVADFSADPIIVTITSSTRRPTPRPSPPTARKRNARAPSWRARATCSISREKAARAAAQRQLRRGLRRARRKAVRRAGRGRRAGSPLTPYGRAKREAEQLCAESEADFVTARAFAFLGPYLPLDAHFAAGNFLRDALAGGPILVRGDGTALRSYLYPADLVVWLLRMLLRGRRGRAYNVGSDEVVTTAQLARRISPGLSARAFSTRDNPIRATARPAKYLSARHQPRTPNESRTRRPRSRRHRRTCDFLHALKLDPNSSQHHPVDLATPLKATMGVTERCLICRSSSSGMQSRSATPRTPPPHRAPRSHSSCASSRGPDRSSASLTGDIAATRHDPIRRLPRMPVILDEVGPKSATTGQRHAAARCIVAVSGPT